MQLQLGSFAEPQLSCGAIALSDKRSQNCPCYHLSHRLVGPTGSLDVARQLMRLRLSAVWVTMVAFEAPVPVPGGMEGAQTYNTYRHIPLACGNTIGGWLEIGGMACCRLFLWQCSTSSTTSLPVAARVSTSGVQPWQLIACAQHVGACLQVPLCKAALC